MDHLACVTTGEETQPRRKELVGSWSLSLWLGQEQKLQKPCFPQLSTFPFSHDFLPEFVVRCVGLRSNAGVLPAPEASPRVGPRVGEQLSRVPASPGPLPAAGGAQSPYRGCYPSLQGSCPGRKTSARVWTQALGPPSR